MKSSGPWHIVQLLNISVDRSQHHLSEETAPAASIDVVTQRNNSADTAQLVEKSEGIPLSGYVLVSHVRLISTTTYLVVPSM